MSTTEIVEITTIETTMTDTGVEQEPKTYPSDLEIGQLLLISEHNRIFRDKGKKKHWTDGRVDRRNYAQIDMDEVLYEDETGKREMS